MLTTNQLHIDGRRHMLVPATTVEARREEVLLIQADGQERRTALALALTGRMKPSGGSVALGRDDSMAALRRRSAIVDAPDVNAPENHLTVRSLTSEDLALVPLKFRDRTRPTEWLVKHGFRDILGKWVEELEPARLLHLQLELALANHDLDLVVVDSPDRHSNDDDDTWLPLLEQAAAGWLGRGPEAHAGTPPRPLMVVAVVGRIPAGWAGAAAAAGNAVPEHATPDDVAKPAAAAAEAPAAAEPAEAPEPSAAPEPGTPPAEPDAPPAAEPGTPPAAEPDPPAQADDPAARAVGPLDANDSGDNEEGGAK